MADLDLNSYNPEELKKWVESLKGNATTPEAISEAARDAQFLSESASRASKPIGTLGDILPKEALQKSIVSPAQQSAAVFEANPVNSLPKSIAERAVQEFSIPGKSAADSASVFQKLAPEVEKAVIPESNSVSQAVTEAGKIKVPIDPNSTAYRLGKGVRNVGQTLGKAAKFIPEVGMGIQSVSNLADVTQAKDPIGEYLSKIVGNIGGLGMITNTEKTDENADKPSGPLLNTQEKMDKATRDNTNNNSGQDGGKEPPFNGSDLISKLKDGGDIKLESAPAEEKESDDNEQNVISSDPEYQSLVKRLDAYNKQAPSLKNLNFGDNELGSVQGLKDAQQQRNNAVLINQLGKAGELIGTGIGGTGNRGIVTRGMGAPIFDENIKQAENIPKDYLAQVEMQKEDPNSAVSKGYRDLMKQFGVNVDGKASASAIAKIAPWVEKAYLAEESRKAQAENLKYKYQELKTIADIKNKERQDARKEALDLKEKLNKDRLDSQYSRQAQSITNKAISGGGQVGNQIRSGIINAERIFNTLGVDKDIPEKDIDSYPIEKLDKNTRLTIIESAIELNKLLSGSGVPAQKTLDKLIPYNVKMGKTSIEDYFTNELNPAQQGKFIKEIMKITARVRDSSKEHNTALMKQYLSSGLEIKKHSPELWQGIINELKVDDPYASKTEKKEEVKQLSLQQKSTPSVNEERRKTQDGRTAVFDSTTKKFIRYE